MIIKEIPAESIDHPCDFHHKIVRFALFWPEKLHQNWDTEDKIVVWLEKYIYFYSKYCYLPTAKTYREKLLQEALVVLDEEQLKPAVCGDLYIGAFRYYCSSEQYRGKKIRGIYDLWSEKCFKCRNDTLYAPLLRHYKIYLRYSKT